VQRCVSAPRGSHLLGNPPLGCEISIELEDISSKSTGGEYSEMA
jgi:hypothetical protein